MFVSRPQQYERLCGQAQLVGIEYVGSWAVLLGAHDPLACSLAVSMVLSCFISLWPKFKHFNLSRLILAFPFDSQCLAQHRCWFALFAVSAVVQHLVDRKSNGAQPHFVEKRHGTPWCQQFPVELLPRRSLMKMKTIKRTAATCMCSSRGSLPVPKKPRRPS